MGPHRQALQQLVIGVLVGQFDHGAAAGGPSLVGAPELVGRAESLQRLAGRVAGGGVFEEGQRQQRRGPGVGGLLQRAELSEVFEQAGKGGVVRQLLGRGAGGLHGFTQTAAAELETDEVAPSGGVGRIVDGELAEGGLGGGGVAVHRLKRGADGLRLGRGQVGGVEQAQGLAGGVGVAQPGVEVGDEGDPRGAGLLEDQLRQAAGGVEVAGLLVQPREQQRVAGREALLLFESLQQAAGAVGVAEADEQGRGEAALVGRDVGVRGEGAGQVERDLRFALGFHERGQRKAGGGVAGVEPQGFAQQADGLLGLVQLLVRGGLHVADLGGGGDRLERVDHVLRTGLPLIRGEPEAGLSDAPDLVGAVEILQTVDGGLDQRGVGPGDAALQEGLLDLDLLGVGRGDLAPRGAGLVGPAGPLEQQGAVDVPLGGGGFGAGGVEVRQRGLGVAAAQQFVGLLHRKAQRLAVAVGINGPELVARRQVVTLGEGDQLQQVTLGRRGVLIEHGPGGGVGVGDVAGARQHVHAQGQGPRFPGGRCLDAVDQV